MAVCAKYRLSHSEFLGWSAADRDKAIWWMLWNQNICQQCGTHPDEWDEDQGGHRRAYHGYIVICPGCVVKERVEDAPEMKDTAIRGTRVALMRNTDPDSGGI